MLSTPTTIKQIDAWRAADSETEHLEFKEAKNRFDFETLLKYCVALANERGGVLLLGIADKPPRPVVGTNAYPAITKIEEDLFNRLRFRVDIEEVQHKDGRVLVFHIPPRPTGHPYEIDGSYYMRVGGSLVPMTQGQLKQVLNEEKSRGKMLLGRKLVYFVVLLLLTGIGLGTIYWNAAHKLPPENHPTTDKVTATVRRDWHNKLNWREYLRVGMTRNEVRELFGEAERIRVSSDLEAWDYGSGEIEFYQGALYSWSEPD